MSTTFIVQPQRSNGHFYEVCEPHRATSWAVVRCDEFRRAGRKFKTSRVISREATRNQAQSLADANTKSFTPTPRDQVRKLGRRIIRKGA